MTIVSSTISLNQPVEKVFAYVIAAENHKAWQTGVLEAKDGVSECVNSNPLATLVHIPPFSCGGSFPAVVRQSLDKVRWAD
jgi:hypothetical protein